MSFEDRRPTSGDGAWGRQEERQLLRITESNGLQPEQLGADGPRNSALVRRASQRLGLREDEVAASVFATEEEKFRHKLDTARKAEAGTRLRSGESRVDPDRTGGPSENCIGEPIKVADSIDRIALRERDTRTTKRLPPRGHDRSARGARLRYLLRYDPVRWCREFSVAPDDASSAGELSSKARFASESEALDQVRSEFSQRFYFTLERAAKALIQTFDVPRYQRSAVKRLLQKRWTFPLGENELLKSGQLQKEEICYFKEEIPDTAWEALFDAVGRVHDLTDAKIMLLQQHLLSSDERITERESLAAELRKTPLKVLGRMEDKYAVELEVLRDSALGDLIQRVLDEINVEGAMNPNANEERLTAVFLVSGSFLETTKGLARAEKPDGSRGVAIRVVGAGGAGLPCNGDYVEVTEGPLHNYRDHPVYKNRLTGAVIFWAGFWKMNYTSQTSGWYYAHEHSYDRTRW